MLDLFTLKFTLHDIFKGYKKAFVLKPKKTYFRLNFSKIKENKSYDKNTTTKDRKSF